MTKARLRSWAVPVTEALDSLLQDAVKSAHVSKADFVRESVRRSLREMGYLGMSNFAQEAFREKLRRISDQLYEEGIGPQPTPELSNRAVNPRDQEDDHQ